jgi:hypothetical protein
VGLTLIAVLGLRGDKAGLKAKNYENGREDNDLKDRALRWAV